MDYQLLFFACWAFLATGLLLWTWGTRDLDRLDDELVYEDDEERKARLMHSSGAIRGENCRIYRVK
jgi:hypothetical protein